jgi:hypothetical protein
VQSRAYDTTWDPDDRVGIYMLEHNTTNVYDANVPYKIAYENTNDWLVPTDGELIMYPNNSDVNFVAYYPYNSKKVEIDRYPVDVVPQETEEQSKAIDLMIHNGFGTPYGLYDGIAVPLEFTHKLSKLTITATPKEGSGINLAQASLTISGMPRTANYNLNTDDFTELATDPTDIIVWRKNPDDSALAEWVAFIIPHDGAVYSRRTFTITDNDGIYYIYPLWDEYKFESGKVYEYVFELGEEDTD